MPRSFPPEFKRDVVRVAHGGEVSQAEVAADFDISVESVRRWVRQADIDDDDVVDGQTSAEQSELVQLRRGKRRRSWRTRSCAERRPTSPRARSQNELPAGP